MWEMIAFAIGVPGTIMGIVELYRFLHEKLPIQSKDTANLPVALPPKRGERVLLDLDPSKKDVLGTFEHKVFSVQEQIPNQFRFFYAWYNPKGFSDGLQLILLASSLNFILALALFFFLVSDTVYENIGISRVILFIILVTASLVCTNIFVKAIKAYRLINGYMAFLKENEIQISAEFTQSKTKYQEGMEHGDNKQIRTL